MWRTTAVVGALRYSRHVRDSQQHVANQMTAAHYITILRKIQILNLSAVNLEQSVSKGSGPIPYPYLPILQMPSVEKSDSCNHPYVQGDE
jgi:hypothetical protein